MKKKIFIGSIIAVVLLTLVSFSSVVGYSSVENNPDATPIEFELQRIRDLVQSINLQKIIVNPYGVIDTLEEVSTLIEEEDVRNYIEKSSEEDCGCEDETTEWGFPIICILLAPLFIFSLWLYMMGDFTFPLQIVWNISEIFNCPWV